METKQRITEIFIRSLLMSFKMKVVTNSDETQYLQVVARGGQNYSAQFVSSEKIVRTGADVPVPAEEQYLIAGDIYGQVSWMIFQPTHEHRLAETHSDISMFMDGVKSVSENLKMSE